jgi:hypothetical protein
MNNYLFMSRSPNRNIGYSARAAANAIRKPVPGLLYKMKDFLTNNWIAWAIHDWHIKKRFDYPTQANASIHRLRSHRGEGRPISLLVAADWATATPQAGFVGDCMQRLSPDYTIHLGDTYYSGTAPELADNFGDGVSDPTGIWPRGAIGSFALAGNHEMYSSGTDYLAMIRNGLRHFGERSSPGQGLAGQGWTGQELPFFCLLSGHWSIIGLDTGYNCLQTAWYKRIFNLHPNDLQLTLPDLLMKWLRANPEVLDPGRGIVLLSHHQYASAFNDESEFTNPAKQLKELLGDREVVWIWGHEHRWAVYGQYRLSPDHIVCCGRCIGNGSMVDEHLPERSLDPVKAVSRNLEVRDSRVADTFQFGNKAVDVGYNGYLQMEVDGTDLRMTYWAAYWNGDENLKQYNAPLYTETWRVDPATGSATRISFTDLTVVSGATGLSYPPY